MSNLPICRGWSYVPETDHFRSSSAQLLAVWRTTTSMYVASFLPRLVAPGTDRYTVLLTDTGNHRRAIGVW